MQELQGIQTTLTDQNTATQALITQIQGTDVATAATTFSTLQTALQATLEASAANLNLSLLNYIT